MRRASVCALAQPDREEDRQRADQDQREDRETGEGELARATGAEFTVAFHSRPACPAPAAGLLALLVGPNVLRGLRVSAPGAYLLGARGDRQNGHSQESDDECSEQSVSHPG
jgi:hypothetical protein